MLAQWWANITLSTAQYWPNIMCSWAQGWPTVDCGPRMSHGLAYIGLQHEADAKIKPILVQYWLPMPRLAMENQGLVNISMLYRALEYATKCEENPVYSLEAMRKTQYSCEHSRNWRKYLTLQHRGCCLKNNDDRWVVHGTGDCQRLLEI